MPFDFRRQLFALLLLLTLGAIWGSGYAIARYATLHGVPPLGYAFWQSLGPSLFLIAVCQCLKVKIPIRLQHFRFYLISGLIGIAIPNSNMYFAAAHLPAGLLAILVNTVPLITYTLTLLLRLEHFVLKKCLGVLLGFIGIMSILLPHATLPSFETIPWIFVILITPFCFAICAIYAQVQFKLHFHPMASAAGMLCFSTLLLLPVVLITHNFYLLNFPLHVADWLILLEIFLSSLGYILFFQLLKKAGAVYYSLVGGIVMLTGLFWGWLVFGEKLNFWTSFSALLILFGVSLVTIGQ